MLFGEIAINLSSLERLIEDDLFLKINHQVQWTDKEIMHALNFTEDKRR